MSLNKWIIGGATTLAIIFGLTFCSPAEAASLEDLPKMKTEMFDPSVQLGGFCSGTIINSDRDEVTGKVSTIILTAKHCTEKVGDKIPIVIRNYNKSNRQISVTSHNGVVIGQSYKSDLAIIRLVDDNTLFPVAKIAPRETGESLLFGQDTFAISYPLGQSLTLTEGVLGFVEEVPQFSQSGEFYRSTPDTGPGSSGSGLFQNTTGTYELIGTLTGAFRGFTFMNLYTPIEEIHDYLDVAKQTYEVN